MRARYRAKGDALFQAPEAERRATIGSYATVPLDKFAGLGSTGLSRTSVAATRADGAAVARALHALASDALVQHPDAKLKIGQIDPSVLAALARHPFGANPPAPTPGAKPRLRFDPDLLRGAGYHKLGLFLTRVRCVLESDELGNDEIQMGGTFVRPDGTTSIRTPFFVSQDMGSDDDDQHLVTYGGDGMKFAEWDLVIPGPHRLPEAWPTYYGSLIAMSEQDEGGFYEFLKHLWDKVSAAVTAAVGTAVGGAVGGALGGVIGAVAGAIVGALIGWLISVFQNPDEILGVVPLNLYLGAMTESYYAWAKLIGVPHTFTLRFTGDNSDYRADFHFRVYP